jgi:hypothetical protein
MFEILKESAREEAEDLEPEPKERDMTVLNLTAGFGLTEADINLFEDIESNEQRTVKTRQGLRGCLLAMRRF